MSVTVRFAPSPTGRLHAGNIRTALHNYLFARRHGGSFMLRIDDTDRERSTATFDQAIHDDLEWLGLKPDRVVRQSERFDLYEREFERLKRAERVYACYETPQELEMRRKVLLGRGLPPVYERQPEGAPVPAGTLRIAASTGTSLVAVIERRILVSSIGGLPSTRGAQSYRGDVASPKSAR